ncbi:MAG: YlxR family protein [Bacilli bacterium]|nr:YlxR family protein [Bacilli bacterium]
MMKMKKIPMRSCVVTHEKCEKKDLIRVVKNKDNEIFVDTTGKANGKGAYLKRDISVIEKAKKNKVLNKVFESEIPDSIYNELIEFIK